MFHITKNKKYPFIKRLIAYFIDWYIISIFTIIPINLIYSLTYQQKNFESTITNLPVLQASLAFGIGLLLSILYLVYYPYKHNGQTIGKRLLGLRIMKNNQEKLDMKTLFIRNGIGLIFIEGTFYTCSIYFWELMNLVFSSSLSAIAFTVLGIISIVSMAMSLMTHHHCMLHDLLAKTNVIAIQK